MNPTLMQQFSDPQPPQEQGAPQRQQAATVPDAANNASPLPQIDTSAVNEVARAVVEEVWEPCFRDTAPFTGIP